MPIPHNPNGAQSALEAAAIAARASLIPRNTYNNVASSNSYGVTHTRAVADVTTPNAGKGTGTFLDINNYNGGSDMDKNGNPSVAGSGRNSAFGNNLGVWGYDPTHKYVAPNTSLNSGQVII